MPGVDYPLMVKIKRKSPAQIKHAPAFAGRIKGTKRKILSTSFVLRPGYYGFSSDETTDTRVRQVWFDHGAINVMDYAI